MHANTSAVTQLRMMFNHVVMKGSGWNGPNGQVVVLHVSVVLNTVVVVTHVLQKSIWNHDHVVIPVTGPNGLNGLVALPHVTVVPNIATVITLVVPLPSSPISSPPKWKLKKPPVVKLVLSGPGADGADAVQLVAEDKL